MECVIDCKYHRNIMGAKGSNVQAITQDHNVNIKFPERSPAKSTPPEEQAAVNGSEEEGGDKDMSTDPKNIIIISGRTENVEAAKQALLVSFLLCTCTAGVAVCILSYHVRCLLDCLRNIMCTCKV